MGRAVFNHTIRRLLREPALPWWVAAAGTVSLLAAIVPVRFREPSDFLLESLESTQLLAGLVFAAIFALPATRPDRCFYAPERWGVPAVGAFRVVFLDGLATAAVLAAGLGVLCAIQLAIVAVFGALSAIGFSLIHYSAAAYAYSVGLVAWARLIGARLPVIPGMVLLFGVAVAPQFVSSLLLGAAENGWGELPPWKLGLLAVLPQAPPTVEDRAPLGLLLTAGGTMVWFVAANLLVSWSLGHLQPDRGTLDRPPGGS